MGSIMDIIFRKVSKKVSKKACFTLFEALMLSTLWHVTKEVFTNINIFMVDPLVINIQ